MHCNHDGIEASSSQFRKELGKGSPMESVEPIIGVVANKRMREGSSGDTSGLLNPEKVGKYQNKSDDEDDESIEYEPTQIDEF